MVNYDPVTLEQVDPPRGLPWKIINGQGETVAAFHSRNLCEVVMESLEILTKLHYRMEKWPRD